MTWPAAWRQSRSDTPSIKERDGMTVFSRVYIVPRGAIDVRPEPGDLLPGETALTGERVLTCGTPSAHENQFRVNVETYKIIGTPTRLSGESNDLIELRTSGGTDQTTGQRTLTITYACLTGSTPGQKELGSVGPTGYADYLLIQKGRPVRQWPGHDLLSYVYVDRRASVTDDGRVKYETLTEAVASGGVAPAPGDKYTGDTDLTGRYVFRIEFARPLSGGITLYGVTYYTIQGTASAFSGETNDIILLPGSGQRQTQADRVTFTVQAASLAGVTPTGLPAIGEAYSGDANLLCVDVQYVPDQWTAHDLHTIVYLDVQDRVLENGWRRQETRKVIVDNGGTLPAAGGLLDGETALSGLYVARVEYAKPYTGGKTECLVVYESRQNGTAVEFMSPATFTAYELGEEFYFEQIGTNRWRGQRVFEVATANVGNLQQALYGSAVAGHGAYGGPVCYRSITTATDRPGIYRVKALYVTKRTTAYATIEFDFSGEWGPLPQFDQSGVQLWGTVAGQKHYRKITKGYESMPKGKCLVRVKAAYSGQFNPTAFLLDKLWHVNSSSVTIGTTGESFAAGTLLLLGAGNTKIFRSGSLWYVNYVFAYEPDGHNGITKVGNFCDVAIEEPAYTLSGSTLSVVEGETRTVMRSLRGTLTAADPPVFTADTTDIDTELFDDFDISTLAGLIAWDETPYDD